MASAEPTNTTNAIESAKTAAESAVSAVTGAVKADAAKAESKVVAFAKNPVVTLVAGFIAGVTVRSFL